MEFLKKNKKFITWALIITLIIIPLVIQGVINWDTMNNGSDDGWLGFWGGYLGSIIGVVGTLIAIQIQLSNEKKRFDKELSEEKKARRSEQVDNTFFNLLLLFNDQKNTLLKDNNHFEKLSGNIYRSSIVQLKRMGIDKFYDSSQALIIILDNMIKEFDAEFNLIKANYPKNVEDCLSAIRTDYLYQKDYLKKFNINKNELKSIKPEIDKIGIIFRIEKGLIENIKCKRFSESTRTNIYNLDALISELKFNSEIYFFDYESKSILKKYTENLQRYTYPSNLHLLELSYKKSAIENSINGYYSSIDSFFSMILRILNYINQNVDKEENERLKKDYLSFLRANISETQLVILYYFAYYTDRGAKMKKELLATSFFGEQDELSTFDKALFFQKKSLIWGEEDLKNMQEFC
ncbi:putative phage abortive infection protein [Enterococcus casseliflavus]|uniref:putative phage abortive infection protein n=1 Tax=Enterococcus casseliflavus TaxID=37734 RepID=UPI0039A51AA1